MEIVILGKSHYACCLNDENDNASYLLHDALLVVLKIFKNKN